MAALTLKWADAAAALPDDDTLVLVALGDGDVLRGFRPGGMWRHADAMLIAAWKVTHWMHLPPAPGVAA